MAKADAPPRKVAVSEAGEKLDHPEVIEERKASATESRAARTVDVNKVETKRAKLTRAAYDQGPSARPSKDQHGNNQKRHYATWKYFVRKAPPADASGPQEEERQKFYITAAGDRLLPEAGGSAAAQQEQHVPY